MQPVGGCLLPNPGMHRHDTSRSVQSFIAASRKTRKRGCSSESSCSSSSVNGYRFKKAVVTRAPFWKQSPRYVAALVEAEGEVCDGRVSRPVSARKLAATLWVTNKVPSPAEKARRGGSKERRSLSSFPHHLSDPSHSPSSERLGGSRPPGSLRRRMPAITNWIKRNAAMEIETRSRQETPRGSNFGVRDRLKDVSKAILTSKELLKIIDHVCGREGQPSSSVSLVSALHQELERARLQVDQLIREQHRSGQTDVRVLVEQFAEEKVAWKLKEQEVVEATIQSVAGELEGERRLRRRLENLNKKLGAELANMKGLLQKATEELESEKRTRHILEQVCDEIAGNIGEDKAQFEQLKIESEKALEEVEKEREMLRLADLLHEERVQMKLSEAKIKLEKKNAAAVKLNRELETVLKHHKTKSKTGCSSRSRIGCGNSAEIAQILDSIRFSSGDYKMENDGKVEGYANSELHSENRSYKMHNGTVCNSSRLPVVEEDFGRRSISGRRPSRSSNVREDAKSHRQTETFEDFEHELERNQSSGYQRRLQTYGFGDAMHLYKYPNVARDLMFANYPKESPVRFVSPVRQWGQVRAPKDPHIEVSEMHSHVYSTGSRSRLSDARSETMSRRSKR
uniref:Uncharacterized protein n=1 Tax=Kalanchoe fedtschenkoi TaxID=63787 RepID=A0A7N0UPD9_KALFE